MFLSVYVDDLMQIRNDDTTHLSSMPNEIFQLVLGFFIDDCMICRTVSDVDDYSKRIFYDNGNNGIIHTINNNFEISEIKGASFKFAPEACLIHSSDEIFLIRRKLSAIDMNDVVRDYAFYMNQVYYDSSDDESSFDNDSFKSCPQVKLTLPLTFRRAYRQT